MNFNDVKKGKEKRVVAFVKVVDCLRIENSADLIIRSVRY